MSVTISGLIAGNLNPLEMVELIRKSYGGDNFSIHYTSIDNMYKIRFTENLTDEQMKLKPWERTKHKVDRTMFLWTNSECAGDYEHVTQAEMTLFSLGAFGDAENIIKSMVNTSWFGFIKNELNSDDWVELTK